eukprot:gene7740-9070_t
MLERFIRTEILEDKGLDEDLYQDTRQFKSRYSLLSNVKSLDLSARYTSIPHFVFMLTDFGGLYMMGQIERLALSKRMSDDPLYETALQPVHANLLFANAANFTHLTFDDAPRVVPQLLAVEDHCTRLQSLVYRNKYSKELDDLMERIGNSITRLSLIDEMPSMYMLTSLVQLTYTCSHIHLIKLRHMPHLCDLTLCAQYLLASDDRSPFQAALAEYLLAESTLTRIRVDDLIDDPSLLQLLLNDKHSIKRIEIATYRTINISRHLDHLSIRMPPIIEAQPYIRSLANVSSLGLEIDMHIAQRIPQGAKRPYAISKMIQEVLAANLPQPSTLSFLVRRIDTDIKSEWISTNHHLHMIAIRLWDNKLNIPNESRIKRWWLEAFRTHPSVKQFSFPVTKEFIDQGPPGVFLATEQLIDGVSNITILPSRNSVLKSKYKV